MVTGAAPEFVPAPASLLAFTAWQCGEGALANVAIERALGADPAYSMALLLAPGDPDRPAAVLGPAADDPGGGRAELRTGQRGPPAGSWRRADGGWPGCVRLNCLEPSSS